MKITSQIIFLYFNDYEAGCYFLEEVLDLEPVYNPGWAKVYRSVSDAYIGAVKAEDGSIKSRHKGGTLISLTVQNVDEMYLIFKQKNLKELSEIKYFDDIGLKSFFFKGPEGYDFEIQEFINKDLRALF